MASQLRQYSPLHCFHFVTARVSEIVQKYVFFMQKKTNKNETISIHGKTKNTVFLDQFGSIQFEVWYETTGYVLSIVT